MQRVSRLTLSLLVGFLVVLTQETVLAQSDAEKFAKGRVAIDKYKDCPIALKSLESISEEGRKQPLWVFYMAKIHECLKNFDEAIVYYRKYDELVPGQAEVLEKIGELGFLADKKVEEAAKSDKLEQQLKSSASAALKQASELVAQRKYDEALEALEQAETNLRQFDSSNVPTETQRKLITDLRSKVNNQRRSDPVGLWRDGDGNVFEVTQTGSVVIARYRELSSRAAEMGYTTGNIKFTGRNESGTIKGNKNIRFQKDALKICSGLDRVHSASMTLTLAEDGRTLRGFGDRLTLPMLSEEDFDEDERCRVSNRQTDEFTWTRISK